MRTMTRQAFDSIEWRYPFDLLPRHGLGETFLKWTKLLYTNPTAEILTNSVISKPFSLKMSILLKFIYPFQALPLQLPSYFYKKLDSIFSQLIWNNRKARLRLKLLYLPYEKGGLQVPNLKWYYWATQLSSAMSYLSSSTPPAWVNIEQKSASDLPIKHYLYSSDLKMLKKQKKNNICMVCST